MKTNLLKSIFISLVLLVGATNAWAWWFVPGSWNGWDSKEANSGGVAQMNGSNTITFYNVPAGNYTMKLKKGSTWGNGNYTNKSTSYITSVTKGNGSDDQIKLSKACDLTFTITDQDNWKCDVSASDPSYYIKYNWNGSGWAWSGSLTSSNSYSCTGQYGGSGSFDHTRVSSTDVDGTNATATLVNSPSKGDLCVFTYNTSNKSLTITRCNKVTANSKIYFDNSLTNWSNSNIYFVVGHDKPTAYSKVYKMNAVNNTKLFYAEISETWEDATYYAIVGVDNEWDNGEWGSSNLTSATKYTAAYTAKYDLGTSGCYYITPSTSNNNTAFTITYKEGHNNIPKITATQSAKIRNSITDQQYTTATGTWPATLKLEGTHLTGFGKDKSARSTISSTTSGNNVNYEAVVTGEITHSYTSLSDDYQFDGWIKGSGTSITSTNTTYSYNITAATTVYACFTKKYAVTFGTPGNGSITATADGNEITSGTKVVGGSEIIFTASPSPGYRIQGWYSDANCTSKIAEASTSESYTITSLTGAKTIYVKYEEIPEEKYTVKISTDGNGTVNLNASEQIGKSGKSITATPNEGFDFDHWEVDGGATVADEKAANTTITATKEGSVTAYFKEIMRTIIVTCNNANYGTVSPTSTKAGIATPSENITATPAEGYELTGWSVTSGSNNITLSSTTATTIQVTQAKVDGRISATFQEKKYNITVLKDGKTSTTQQIGAKTQVSITAATLTGFEFVGWVVSDEQTPGCITIDDPTKATIKVTATGTGTITATFRETGVLYFKNNLGWSEVYVYFHTSDSYWDATLGSGSYGLTIANGRAFKMERIGNTDIYKCHYGAKGTVPTNSLAFTPENKEDNGNFYRTKASYRTDFNSQMELFIPQNTKTETKNETDYYSRGVWMKYNSTESGYEWRGATSQEANDPGWSNAFKFTTDKPGGYSFKASVNFDNINQHYFKVRNYNNTWFGNGGTMDQNNCTDWIFGSDNSNNAKITPTITGTYIFTVYLGDGVVKVSLDFPLSTGDYRLVYVDKVTGVHPAHYIKKRNEDRLDTVSFFVHHQNSPRILLQHCTAISNSGVPTWKTDKEYQILKTGGADPTSAQLPGKRKSDAVLYTGEGCGIEESGVYNFVLQQSNSTADLQTAYTHPYVGDFYIRTDAAYGGWDAFRQQSNKITYSSFADSHSNFNHYYCKYIDAGRNVKFTIANDYSYCISDTLDNDDIIKDGQSSLGCLPVNANVRFGWDSNTNEISRAYIKGAGMTSDRFLVLQGEDDNLKDANGKTIPVGTGKRYGLNANEEILVDQQNWIYQVDVTANNQTFVKLIAEYNGQTQYFKGDDKEYTRLLSSTASKDYKIRLVYDFKSNHLIIGWLAGGNTVEGEQILGADMMVIRKDQQPADQLNFDPTASPLKEVGIGYAVMTFTEDHITDDTKTARERSLYWVSFPFDVKISDVFGFGEYAEHWIMQYYDGAERAEKGLFSDSGTYWKYIFDTDTKLKAGEGYVLVLDLSKVEFLYGATEVSLYFPSTNPLTTITGNLPTAATVPAHWCNIDREFEDGGKTYNHKFTDSHWNLIGVPGFADINNFDDRDYHFMQEDVSFYYKFDLTKSIYTVEKNYTVEHATNFQAMYSYMVQFAGTIYWMSKTVEGVTPTEIAARRYSDDQPEKVALRLELAQGEEVADRTFVQMQQEGATANFDLSLDLTKIVNIGVSNIYTLTDSLKIQTAGNVLPFEETTVAVGVDIATAGEYTFRMPDGTEGMVVELIDYETNTTTNLLLDDYTVNLPTGSNETRFALSLKPEKTATSIENTTTPSDSNIRKFIIDGKLYLQKDGMLYDAQGHIVR